MQLTYKRNNWLILSAKLLFKHKIIFQTLKELQDLLKERRLQAHGVELLWVKVSNFYVVPRWF